MSEEKKEEDGGGEHQKAKADAPSTKKRAMGRPSDPRMIRAVEATLAGLSPYDALIKEGFKFDRKDKSGERFDSEDGVTITQRKNNLCRRVRQAKKERTQKQQEEQKLDPQQVSDARDELYNCSESSSARVVTATSSLGPTFVPSTDDSRLGRRDSFDDAISEINWRPRRPRICIC